MKTFLIVVAIILCASFAHADSFLNYAIATWTTPTQYTNDQPLPLADVKGFNLYCDINTNPTLSSPSIYIPMPSPPVSNMSYTFYPTKQGRYLCAVTSITTLSAESDLGNIAEAYIYWKIKPGKDFKWLRGF